MSGRMCTCVANGESGCSEAPKNQDWQISVKFVWNRSMPLLEGVQNEWIYVSPISASRHPLQRRREGSRVVEASQAQSLGFPVLALQSYR